MVVRVHKPQLQELDRWIARQEEEDLSRPEAIRRMMNLVMKGLPAVRRSAVTFAKR
jgi:hypothetical protein